jgi:hypothetical protein
MNGIYGESWACGGPDFAGEGTIPIEKITEAVQNVKEGREDRQLKGHLGYSGYWYCRKCGKPCVPVWRGDINRSDCCDGAITCDEPGKPANARQVGGNHYQNFAISPFDYAMANNLNAFQFSVVKYVTRYPVKGGIEDLRKCADVLQRLIEYEESK